jgi:putative ABC transport system substrate-binding protein
MKRREFIALLGGAAASGWSRASLAQPSKKIARIGFLGATSQANHRHLVDAFRAGLRELGYEEGRDCVIDYRWAEDRYDRLPELAADLVRIGVDVIVTHGTPGTLAAKRATVTIPIVMATSGDAVASGLVAGLSRPGGNVTGLTFFNPELVEKRIELLKELAPRMSSVAALINPENPVNEVITPAIKVAAAALGVEVQQFGVRSPAEFEHAFLTIAQSQIRTIVIYDDAMLIANAKTVADWTAKQRLLSAGFTDFSRAGGLIGYGVSLADMFRRAATFVDKVLKGVKPADQPIERSTKFTFMINLKTAKALGVEFPVALLARADEVIE